MSFDDKKVVVGTFQKRAAIPGMLLFGTATVVTGKLLFQMHAGSKEFKKPWWQVVTMFAGMLGCLGVYYCLVMYRKFSAKEEENVPLKSGVDEGEEIAPLGMKAYIKIFPPAMCDLVATGLMNIGLLYIPASVWQLLRGSMVIFSAILSIIFLKRRVRSFQWFAIFLVLLALVAVGVSCVMSDTNGGGTQSQEIVGIFLVVGAQVIQAAQIVIEDYLLKGVKAPAVLIVGIEGFWGFFTCIIVVLPILYFIPEPYGEDTIDTFHMMNKNNVLIWVTFIYIGAILLYNMTGMFVTQIYTAVHRTILEAMRTLCIWITDLVIYYFISSQHGEQWSAWSWLELAGFITLVNGTFVYNRVYEIPCFKYPPVEKEPAAEEKDALLDSTQE
jgi:drug/metabolite transporter (DMT)-like permease